MTTFLYSALAFVVAIGVLVIVHEFGHYWVARRLGIKVLRFSVGFGKPLWSRRFGADQTELVVAALPLGGYVKMLDETEGAVPPGDLHRAFNRQPLVKRGAVVLAGPAFNFLFAVAAYWALFSVGISGIKPIVGKVVKGSIAQKAGFQVGDDILSIDGRPTLSWDQQRLYLFAKALDKSRVRFRVRDPQGRIETRILDLSSLSANRISSGMLETATGLFGYSPRVAPVIGTVISGSPAAKAGLEPGDRMVSINGKPIRSWDDVVSTIRASAERRIRLTVERAGARISFSLTPETVVSGGQRIGRIGVGVKPPQVPADMRVLVRLNPWSALRQSAEDTWLMSSITVKMLVKMLELKVSTRTISGPITIARYAGYTARIGFGRFLMFLAVISISLGVLNLLPVPVLDGGHLLVYVIEAIKGGPLPERALYWGQQVGVILLAALMALAFYNDFVRLLQ
ncbi:MAG: RIP metalloprotease RseP [Gammaproteobacteria bacterium]|nr:RIP metalloprotease RseP [Gammaproteobacteria bacterium]